MSSNLAFLGYAFSSRKQIQCWAHCPFSVFALNSMKISNNLLTFAGLEKTDIVPCMIPIAAILIYCIMGPFSYSLRGWQVGNKCTF